MLGDIAAKASIIIIYCIKDTPETIHTFNQHNINFSLVITSIIVKIQV